MKPSSSAYPKLALAQGATLALAMVAGLLAQEPAGLPRNLRESSVGERLAADLTWSQAERDSRFAHMDLFFPIHRIRRAGPVRQLPAGVELPLPQGAVESYMRDEHIAGLLVLQDGNIRLEKYALGLASSTRWTSFSMTKAMTDTLAGVALQTGAIRSLEDDVTRYLPEMRGSAYDGVSVRQLMTMTTGVGWNENYTSPDADNVRLYTTPAAPGRDQTVEYMRHLQREAPAGSRWRYNTGETDLLGVLLRRATGRTLAEQLSAAVWQHAGMEHDATWIASASGPRGEEFGGSGISATLRDWGRVGLWVLRGGDGAVAPGWVGEATRPQTRAGDAPYGYGWWPQGGTHPDGSFAAIGIFGQSMLVDPQRRLVVVTVADWPQATGAEHSRARAEFWQQVKAAADLIIRHP